MSDGNSGFMILGAAGCGKTTFLATLFFLLQTGCIPNVIAEPDPEHSPTVRLLYRWEKALNEGKFPDKSTIDPIAEVRLNLWKGGVKIPLVNFDPGGEIWDTYNPAIEHAADIPEALKQSLAEAAGYIILVDALLAHQQDWFYQRLMSQVRAHMKDYRFGSYNPVALIFSKVDKLPLPFNGSEYAEKKMPRTFSNFSHFFSSPYKEPMIFGCSIGKVAENNGISRLAKFEPIGHLDVIRAMLEVTDVDY